MRRAVSRSTDPLKDCRLAPRGLGGPSLFTASKNSRHDGDAGPLGLLLRRGANVAMVVFGRLLARVRVLVAKPPRARARTGPRRPPPAARDHQAVIRNGFEINQPKSKATRRRLCLTRAARALSFAFIATPPTGRRLISLDAQSNSPARHARWGCEPGCEPAPAPEFWPASAFNGH